MKRPLNLRREALTELDSDELSMLAGARPFTLSLCTTNQDSVDCVNVKHILETIRSTGMTECTSSR